jgi:TonB family protein
MFVLSAITAAFAAEPPPAPTAEALAVAAAPRPTTPPEVAWPAALIAAGAPVSVTLAVEIDALGAVRSAKVVVGVDEETDAAAVAAALAATFTPATDPTGTPTPATIEWVLSYEPPPRVTATVVLLVTDAAGVPIPDAAVVLRGDDGVAAGGRTDATGALTVEVAPGSWTLEATEGARPPAVTALSLDGARRTELQVVLGEPERALPPGEDYVVVVEGTRTPTDTTVRVISVEEIRYLPGTNGDVVKVVQNLPGVARPPLGIGQLIIRGTSPEDSAYALDGGSIPIVFHFAGLTTVMAGDLLQEVAYLPGGYGVRYGRQLGGLVDLRTSDSLPDERHTYVSVDVFQAAAYTQQKISERTYVWGSVRRSYIDAVLNPILNNGGSQFQAPRYYDGQLRVRTEAEGGASFDAMALVSDDRFRVLGSEDEGGEVQIGLSTTFQKLRLIWSRPYGPATLTASLIGGPERQEFAFAGSGEAWERPIRGQLRVEAERPTDGAAVGWRAGLDVAGGYDRYRYDVPGFGPLEAGGTFLVAPAPYAEATLPIGPLRVTPGVRVDTWIFEDGALAPSVDPRLATRTRLTRSTDLIVSGGQYSQAPETRELLLEGDGVPDLQWERSIQTSLGVKQELGRAASVELTGFRSDLFQLVSGREDRFRFFTGPPPTGPLDSGPYENVGTGLVVGGEALLRAQTDRTVALAALTVSRSIRQDRPDEEASLFEYDQPIVFNGLVSHELNKGWRLGARVRTSSGNPFTPVVNRVYDLDSRVFVPVYGEPGSARLPQFFALDLRFDKEWTFRTWSLALYLDLQNATNSTNPEVMSWTYDYGATDPVDSLPTVPAFGLRGDW